MEMLKGPLADGFYEDPILLNEINKQMAKKIKEAERKGVKVTHNYGEDYFSREAYPYGYIDAFNKINKLKAPIPPGGGSADVRSVDAPRTPSLLNNFILSEELNHNLFANTVPPLSDNMSILEEENIAKNKAISDIGGYLYPELKRTIDATRDSYKDMIKNPLAPYSGTINIYPDYFMDNT